jgi:hypothetical protein
VVSYQVLIIGAGPAGLSCALHAAGENRSVLVLEKNPSPGRKLLITGSGQCNITHQGDISGFSIHYGDHGSFLRPALRNFTNRNLIRFFEEHGCPMTTGENGKIFPASKRASDILGILLSECRRRSVKIRCNEAVTSVRMENGRFMVKSRKSIYSAETLVIATGGASYPTTGSSGDGYILASELGQTVTEISPALTPVYIADYPFSDLAGISFDDLTISLFRNLKRIRQVKGDLLCTHLGFSGPGVLDLSRYIVSGDQLKIGFIPHMNKETVRGGLIRSIEFQGSRQVKTILQEFSLPERFIRRLLELTGIPGGLPGAQLSRSERNSLIRALTEFPFTVERLGGFDEAMVTRGGVALQKINAKTMESVSIPHLYCIGEVLDIDGDTGGYNLQAAISTGVLAARHINGSVP